MYQDLCLTLQGVLLFIEEIVYWIAIIVLPLIRFFFFPMACTCFFIIYNFPFILGYSSILFPTSFPPIAPWLPILLGHLLEV